MIDTEPQSITDLPLIVLPETSGPPPSRAMIESVREHSVLVPILVAERDHGYHVIDGNRRLAAARAATLTSIPAIVVRDLSERSQDLLTLVANGMRSANPSTEAVAIAELEDGGVGPKRISQESGLSSSTVKKRQAITNAHHVLRDGYAAGHISTTAIEAAAKCEPHQQTDLATLFQSTGVLHASDVAKITNAPETRSTVPPRDEPTEHDLPYGIALQTLLRAAQRSQMTLSEVCDSLARVWE